LCITTDGALLAWVQGGDRYATLVRCTGAGKLSSTCTCPYGSSCKHAVATILAYLDCVQTRSPPPAAESDDERFAELARDADSEEENETFPISAPSPGDRLIRAHLATMTKAKLIDLLLQERNVIPELRQQLADQAELKEGNLRKLIAATRREIDNVTHEPGWQDHWKHDGYTPDYSRLTKRLENLLNAGHADAVVELGAYLLPKGMHQAECSHDEGETSYELIGSLNVVYQALAQSSLSPVQQILWDIDAQLLDPYDILGHVQGPIDAHKNNHVAT